LAPDITGVWSADPNLTELSGYLTQNITDRFKRYRRIALIAHSMGGLIVERAILDGGDLDKISHVLLFGTPSGGLRKAGLGRIFKRQARDMTAGQDFITNLRKDWNTQFNNGVPFYFRTVAGLSDQFVPTNSSLDPFRAQFRGRVAGNHLEMVKPQTAESDTVLLVLNALMPNSDAGAKLASKNDSLQKTITELLPKKDSLDAGDLVKLALALEMMDRQSEAIQILRSRYKGNTEITGVLAGRLKRRWLTDPETHAAEGIEAEQLYALAFEQAKQAGDHQQAFYNGINTAFMVLAVHNKKEEAKVISAEVLEHCKLAKADKWRHATEGEANLYLGNTAAALGEYKAVLAENPTPREVDSIYQQALWAARLLDQKDAEAGLDKVFQERQ
jgi:pimeloyl-ACP methyl ester carboxylesterase